MRIYKVEIERFRGIKRLEWIISGDFICLIGPGDSTKSTILDAIELTLSPRWNIQFDDNDFYNAKADEPILITVTIGGLPEELKSDAKYGLQTRGWSKDGVLHDEPEDDDDLVLTIRLCIEPSLEQSWVVVNDRNPEGIKISARDREKLGCSRLGQYVDRHLSWSRGSTLMRLTGQPDELSGILADASRAARSALTNLKDDDLPSLYESAKKVQQLGADLGVCAKTTYRPYLDAKSVSFGAGGLSLHDGSVPVRMAGLGSRRLLAIAIQRELAKTGGITLVDEVEHCLEPHRIRRLLNSLRDVYWQDDIGQVLMTTHATLVLEELNADDLRIVRSKDGTTEVLKVTPTLQPIVRKASEAMLARKIIVCEGRTEIGLCRRLDKSW